MQENISESAQTALFKRLGSRKENNICADCKTCGATWTSMSFGVFVCITCSGIHRSFGMHITRVRSTKLDSWTLADSKIMEIIGNTVANLYWEHTLPPGKQVKLDSDSERAHYIKQKYISKLWVKQGVQDPVSLVLKNFSTKTEDLIKLYSHKPKDGQITSDNGFVENGHKHSESSHKGSFSLPAHHKPKKCIASAHEDLIAFDDFKPTPAPIEAVKTPQNDPFLWDFTQGAQQAVPKAGKIHTFPTHPNEPKEELHKKPQQPAFQMPDYHFDFTKPGASIQAPVQTSHQNHPFNGVGNFSAFNNPFGGMTHTPNNLGFHNDKYAALDSHKMHYSAQGFKYY